MLKEFMARLKGGNVTVNGQTYRGSSVSIVNGTVIVDGVIQSQQLGHRISVSVQGPVESVESAAGDISVTGDVGRVKTVSGDVTCADVKGDVATVSGDVKASSITGSATTVSGDIRR